MAEDNSNILDEELVKGCKNKKDETISTTTSTIRKNNNKRAAAATKKDRHSKINTAQGPRDRRMRLSLEVARKFFNLQDLLKFDKASKTVEWLLTKSKSSVDELVQGLHINKENSPIAGAAISTSSTSESCEVISVIIDEPATNNNDIQKQQKKKVKSIRRVTLIHPVVAKESRRQARARARERTEIKKSLGESMTDDDLKRLGSWSPFEDHQSGIQGYNNSNNIMNHHHEKQHDLIGTKENVVNDNCNFLVDTGNWSPFPIFSYHHINTEISQEHQFTNFQYSGKLWEA
ncbi:hypothetical protein K7X08_024091 [Anisodus acutangulus]|uniref:Uncharacterized protein n=1 Tax=Anisodus acutangulus TaxID=402998 RepID=A0A9Q1M873_9SOLA|nr:hypothetical protein K7X08_024091 [Anisodus acutangulus]